MDFCCSRRCVKSPRSVVDGIACTCCFSFCYCRCDCVSLPDRCYTSYPVTISINDSNNDKQLRLLRMSRCFKDAENTPLTARSFLVPADHWWLSETSSIRFSGKVDEKERLFHQQWQHMYHNQRVRHVDYS